MLIALVPLVSFGLNGISQGKQMIKDKAASFLTNLSVRNADAIKQFMIERVNDLHLISSILDMSEANFNSHMNQIVNDPNRPYIDFFVMTGAGQLVFKATDETMDPRILEMAAQAQLSWQGMKIARIFSIRKGNDRIPALLLLKPLESNKAINEALFLCSLVDFRAVSLRLKENNMEDTGEVYLVDEDGWFLSTSRFGAKTFKTRVSMTDHLSQVDSPACQVIDYRGKSVLQARQDIDPFGWVVMADQDMGEILNQVKVLEKKAVFLHS